LLKGDKKVAQNGQLVLRDVDYAALFVISDTESAYTSGLGFQIPGIQKLEVKPDLMKDELYGDARILDVYARAKKATFSLDHAILSFDILEKITGGISLSSGTSPNEQREFIWSNDDQIPYFALMAKCNYQGGVLSGGVGDQLFWLWKCKINSFSVGMKMDGYAICSIEGDAIPPFYVDPTAGKRKLFSIFQRQTAAPISLTVDTTPPTLTNTTATTPGGTVVANAAVLGSVTPVLCFNYSEPLHKAWVSSNGVFSCTKVFDGTDVPITATLNANGTSVDVAPVSALTGTFAYVFADSRLVRDLAGNTKVTRSTRYLTAP